MKNFRKKPRDRDDAARENRHVRNSAPEGEAVLSSLIGAMAAGSYL